MSQPTHPGWSRRRKGENGETSSNVILSWRKTLGLALHGAIHVHPQSWALPDALPGAQHLPTEALGTTRPNPARSHACVSPLGRDETITQVRNHITPPRHGRTFCLRCTERRAELIKPTLIKAGTRRTWRGKHPSDHTSPVNLRAGTAPSARYRGSSAFARRQMVISHISHIESKARGLSGFPLSEIGKERCHGWFCCCYLHVKGGWGRGRQGDFHNYSFAGNIW